MCFEGEGDKPRIDATRTHRPGDLARHCFPLTVRKIAMPRGKLFPGEILPGAHRVLDIPRDIHSNVTSTQASTPALAASMRELIIFTSPVRLTSSVVTHTRISVVGAILRDLAIFLRRVDWVGESRTK